MKQYHFLKIVDAQTYTHTQTYAHTQRHGAVICKQIRANTQTYCTVIHKHTARHLYAHKHTNPQTHCAVMFHAVNHFSENDVIFSMFQKMMWFFLFFRKWCDFSYVSENDVIFSMFQKMIMFSKMMFSSFVTLLRQFKHCRFFKNEKIIIFWHRMDDVKHYQAVCLRVCVFVRVETPRCVLVYHRTMCLCAFVCI